MLTRAHAPNQHGMGNGAFTPSEAGATAAPQPSPPAATRLDRPPSTLERWLFSPINFLTRLGVVGISLTLWCTIALPVWLFLVARAMAVLAFRNVVNIYRGAGTIDVARLEQVVLFWPRGFIAIIALVFGHYDRGDPAARRHPLEAVQETLLAILFFTVMIFSAEVARDYAWIVLKIRDWLLPHAETAFLALAALLRQHTQWPF